MNRFARKAAWLGGAALLVAAPAQADTLREALVEAYNTNPTLAAARAQQRAEDENPNIQRAQGLPSVSATGQYTEFVKPSPNNDAPTARLFSIGPDLNVPIYAGGAVKKGVAAAKERVAAGQASLRGTESAIFSQVVAAYMDVLRTQALVSLNANQVDVLTVNLQATRDRYEIGDLTRTDVAQSESRLALATADLRSAEANLILARETYIQLVGSAPVDLQPPPPLPGLPADPYQAVEIALESNPDLIAAKERASAAGFDTDVAGAGRMPTVSLFAGADYTNYFGTLAAGLDPTLNQAETTASAGVRFSIPIFQGGLPAARQRQAAERENAALEQVIAAERDVIAQTRAAFSSYQASLQVIESSQLAVEAAELSLEGVRAENSIGNRTILDVLNAEQELLRARAQLVTARRNAYVAGFSLLAAMGKAEARDLGLDGGVLYDPMTNYDAVNGRIWDWDRPEDAAATSTRTVDIPPANAEIPADAAELPQP
jgi:outer membrane protein